MVLLFGSESNSWVSHTIYTVVGVYMIAKQKIKNNRRNIYFLYHFFVHFFIIATEARTY